MVEPDGRFSDQLGPARPRVSDASPPCSPPPGSFVGSRVAPLAGLSALRTGVRQQTLQHSGLIRTGAAQPESICHSMQL
ncbi:unnamed protein product [Merluccius merluccius]